MIDKIELINQIKNQPEIRENKVVSTKKTSTKKWFLLLRDIICNDFINLEKDFIKKSYIEGFNDNYVPHFEKKKLDKRWRWGGNNVSDERVSF